MTRYNQLDLGRCDFLDVLEESVLMRARVQVILMDDTHFEDRITDVLTRDGREVVYFAGHEPVELRQIAAITREPLPHTYPPEP